MTFTWSALANYSYWLESNPDAYSSGPYFVALFSMSILASLIVWFLNRQDLLSVIGPRKVILMTLVKINLLLSILGLAFVILRYSEYEYLSMRLWVFIVSILWFLNLVINLIRYFRAKKVGPIEVESTENYQTYLPKKNKKKKGK